MSTDHILHRKYWSIHLAVTLPVLFGATFKSVGTTTSQVCVDHIEMKMVKPAVCLDCLTQSWPV